MKKPNINDFKVPERPSKKDFNNCKKKTTYLETVKKSEKYDMLIGNLKDSKDYLEAHKGYLNAMKKNLKVGYRNGCIDGRIKEVEDRLNWLDSVLGRFE